MSNQHREAGLASALSRRTALGETGFRDSMRTLGKLGGRPTWQAALDKANGNPVRPGAKQEVARAGHQVGPGSHSKTGKRP